MISEDPPRVGSTSVTLLRRVVAVCDRFEDAWRSGAPLTIESTLQEVPETERPECLQKLIELEVELRRDAGESPSPKHYLVRFPAFAAQVDAAFVSPRDFVPQPKDERVSVGRRIGPYQLLRRIGAGGMGIVFESRKDGIDRTVALKLIRPDMLGFIGHSELVERFRVEAQAASRLEHDNIVPVFDVGEQEGLYYYSMRLIEGLNLAEHLHDAAFSPRRAAEIMEGISRGVAHAHERKVLHRDIKPRNILLEKSGRPLLADFGLARRTDMTSVMGIGSPLGTAPYMAPETAKGKESTSLSDVYSLGATLYELVTGRAPFLAADPIATMRMVIDEEPIPPRRLNRLIPPEIETICLKCLEKDPAARYPTAAALADDLRLFQEGRPIVARPVSFVAKAAKWARRKPATALLALAIAAAPFVAGLVVVQWNRAVESTRREGLVSSLATVSTAELPGTIADLVRIGPPIAPRLRELFDANPKDSQISFRAALILMRVSGEKLDYLSERVEQADPEEIVRIRAAMGPDLAGRTADFFEKLQASDGSPDFQLRMAAMLGEAEGVRFNAEDCRKLAGDFAAVANPARAVAWAKTCPSLLGALRGSLKELFLSARDSVQRQNAAAVLAEVLADDFSALAALLEDSDADQQGYLMNKLRRRPAQAVAALATRVPATPKPGPAALAFSAFGSAYSAAFACHSAQDRALEKRVNLAVALLGLGDPTAARALLAERGFVQQIVFIRRLGRVGYDTPDLFRVASSNESFPALRQAVLLVLGERSETSLFGTDGPGRLKSLSAIFLRDPDPGVHSSVEWLLRKTGKQDCIASLERTAPRSDIQLPGNDWAVSKKGVTMVAFRGPLTRPITNQKMMTDPTDDFGPFAVGTKEVTHRLYREYLRGDADSAAGADADMPTTHIRACEAEAFCNWLTVAEGLGEGQCCYSINRGKDGAVVSSELKAGYRGLTGYRLPTVAEFEHASGCDTSLRHFWHRNRDAFGSHSWHLENALKLVHPAGSLMPNRRGLFDMCGNCAEWCMDRRDTEANQHRFFSGISYRMTATELLTDAPSKGIVDYPLEFVGFRVAKSLPAGDKSK